MNQTRTKTKIREIISEDDLLKIDINRLQLNKPLPFDIFIKEGGITKKIFHRGNFYSTVFQSILKEKGISHVYIAPENETLLRSYLSNADIITSELESPVKFKNYSYQKEHYYQIDRNLIVPGIEVEFPIYLLKKLSFNKIVDASLGKPVMIYSDTIPEEGDILIEKKDLSLFREYIEFIEKRADKIAEQKDSSLKHLIVKETAKVIVIDILNDPRSGEKIKKVESSLKTIIETIVNDPESIYELLTLKGYDYYTYTHSVNVGVLSIGLGIQIGLTKEELYRLGIGAILHDIGKTQIPHEILNKQGKLTDTEYNIIKQHVMHGYNLLKEHRDIPPDAFIAVLQHHEKLSGKGYPYGLKGEEVKLFGRITAIADCYDALTTRRPYKPPLTPYFALSIVVRERGDYDAELLRSFIKMLGKVK
ncbi:MULTISPECIES: HD-GYP domain-containing protein [Thermodesulfovibrio]|uniref:HD-GYP domain-containing protein n=1 Tax=Thermodesulfovibrio TaxID=28261 RepID=UPI00261E224A|nr:HD-GYP domain-containing protein [Thermodesulfovibrio sp.]